MRNPWEESPYVPSNCAQQKFHRQVIFGRIYPNLRAFSIGMPELMLRKGSVDTWGQKDDHFKDAAPDEFFRGRIGYPRLLQASARSKFGLPSSTTSIRAPSTEAGRARRTISRPPTSRSRMGRPQSISERSSTLTTVRVRRGFFVPRIQASPAPGTITSDLSSFPRMG